MMDYLKHFSHLSESYLAYRPHYPKELFVFLNSLTKEHDLAWDCGTGNGQAAIALSPHFTKVIATDTSQAQLNLAPKIDNIHYFCWPAQKTKLHAQSVDLITVAQALHWFEFDSFYQEVNRVLKPEGAIAAWCYSLGNISPDINSIIKKLYYSLPWPKERRYIDEHYSTIPFPFNKIISPSFTAEKSFTLDEFLGYLHTWSAVKEHIQQTKINPIYPLVSQLEDAWGDPKTTHTMQWPLHLLIGKGVSSPVK